MRSNTVSVNPSKGEVRITANATKIDAQSFLRVVVADTGSGGDEIQFAMGRHQGVGLNGVEKRLQHYANGKAPMNITSHPGLGTTVDLQSGNKISSGR